MVIMNMQKECGALLISYRNSKVSDMMIQAWD